MSEIIIKYRRLGALFLAAIATFAIFYLDVITKFEINFSIFYLIPVLIVSWTFTRWLGLIFSFIATVLWVVADKFSEHLYSHFSILYWDAAVTLFFFAIIVYLVSRLKTLLYKEKTLSRLNSEMISAISHEFNNLLTGIHLSSILLREDEGEKLSEEREKFYRILDQNYTSMMQNIKVFLNRARLESGKLKLNLQRVEIRDILNRTLEILAPLTFEKNIIVVKEFPQELLPVKCDPDALSLVLSNLISNAIKYSAKNGTITVSIKSSGSDTVEISVKDTGIGIDKSDFDKIFSGFYRTEEGKKKAKGFGIGLKVSREILELHDSVLELESEKGKGSRFYFTLPLYREEAEN